MRAGDSHGDGAEGGEKSAAGGDDAGAEAIGEKTGEELSAGVGEAEDEDEIGEVEGFIIIEPRHHRHDDGEIFAAEIIRSVENPGGQKDAEAPAAAACFGGGLRARCAEDDWDCLAQVTILAPVTPPAPRSERLRGGSVLNCFNKIG